MKQKKAWSFFQSLGKAFMYPIALLSVCGMMLGLGSGLASEEMAKLIPVLGYPVVKSFLDFIVSLGLFAFVNLPVLFAIAIPLGLLKEKEDKHMAHFPAWSGLWQCIWEQIFILKVTVCSSPQIRCPHMDKLLFWEFSHTIPAYWGESLQG